MNNALKPNPETLKLPLEVRAEMALRAALDEVIEEHARNGWPIYVWEDGKVVAIPAEQLMKDLPKKQ